MLFTCGVHMWIHLHLYPIEISLQFTLFHTYTWHSNVSFVAITYYKSLFVIVKHILRVLLQLILSIPFLSFEPILQPFLDNGA